MDASADLPDVPDRLDRHLIDQLLLKVWGGTRPEIGAACGR